jgi:vacuolar-type H+-ATPase subunit H
MKFETTIIIHATEDAKKKKKEPRQKRKPSCQSCEIEYMKKQNDYINENVLIGDNK